ncbi:PQQ-dependent sugar dehydrogenase [Chelativorans sp. M5D2P16]|uniref:PQQ-dependent sugar dehydrogenase n=1 Tax=Chelativorans sp. M5D2P16 TaxID=3095678 RepID=UPI002ACA6255|nr:PQQ-dependent sugar dehydrogenase [Chelativorans sp. M5D2P16]MDZ5698556.1 PQQ-dependent sugar dehydrogenase [Chelativorans sp. M5D2P16]
MTRFVSALAMAAVLCGPGLAQTEGSGTGETAETAAPNAQGQEPAFANQTRAPLPAEKTAVEAETIAQDLPNLWSMEFLPDGRMLVTAREGDMMIVSSEGEAGAPIDGVPEVMSEGQGGLLDVALAPDFEESGMIYFSFSEPREDGGNGTSVARARLETDGSGSETLQDLEVIFRQTPAYEGDMHFGSRLVFGSDGHLFVTVGERSDTPIRDQAQDLTSGLGKIFRINPDGSAPEDNPFAQHAAIQPEIWSYGHRNIQAAALDPDGRLCVVEHGPMGGDELNRPEAGLNYGWPVITYGLDYGGAPIGRGLTAMEGMEQPVYYWDPVIAPSGMLFYQGEEFPAWDGAILVGGLVSEGLVVLHLEDGRVTSEERIPLGARVQDVKVGPDGAVYAITEADNSSSSAIVRVTSQAGE